MHNIQKQSRKARLFFQLLLVTIPIGVIYFWMTTQTQFDYLANGEVVQLSFQIDSLTQLPLTNLTRFLAATASLMLSGIVLYVLVILIRLFRNYEKGEIFSLENVTYFQKLGFCLFYWVAGGIIYGGVISTILSFNNPPGERFLELSFGGMDFLTLVFGFLVLIISWVMEEGYKIADENRLTI